MLKLVCHFWIGYGGSFRIWSPACHPVLIRWMTTLYVLNSMTPPPPFQLGLMYVCVCVCVCVCTTPPVQCLGQDACVKRAAGDIDIWISVHCDSNLSREREGRPGRIAWWDLQCILSPRNLQSCYSIALLMLSAESLPGSAAAPRTFCVGRQTGWHAGGGCVSICLCKKRICFSRERKREREMERERARERDRESLARYRTSSVRHKTLSRLSTGQKIRPKESWMRISRFFKL